MKKIKIFNICALIFLVGFIAVEVGFSNISYLYNNLRINLTNHNFKYHNVVNLDVSEDYLKNNEVSNLDSVWEVVYNGTQEDLDRDKISVNYGDFYHHSSQKFKEHTLWLKPGDLVVVADRVWKVVETGYGHCVDEQDSIKNGLVFYQDETVVQYDKKVQIIQCFDFEDYNRYIITLEPVNNEA